MEEDMTEKELVDAILTTGRPYIDDGDIDAACVKRLKFAGDQFGRDGDVAKDLLRIVERLLDLA
ncbi:hypothetical protein [Geoalkalibacter subterraneus]|nr:hypothetical protein [Geoalkalibacter subterraneus]